MPNAHRYEPETRTLYVELHGVVSEAELLDLARKLTSDPSIPPGHRELVDLTGVEQTDVSATALQGVARIYAASDVRPEESRVAIVAPGDLFFGLSRMYEAYRDPSPVEIRVFRTLADARSWLGLD